MSATEVYFQKSMQKMIDFIIYKRASIGKEVVTIQNIKVQLIAAYQLCPSEIPRKFFEHVHPYMSKVNSKDETFFIEMSQGEGNPYKNLELNKDWNNYSHAEKNEMWRCFEQLFKAASIIVGF